MGNADNGPQRLGEVERGMKVIFRKPKHRLPKFLKDAICECIVKNYMSISSYFFHVHFDVMRSRTGWYSGYVETWRNWSINKNKDEKRRRRFTVQVITEGK